jgi:integrase
MPYFPKIKKPENRSRTVEVYVRQHEQDCRHTGEEEHNHREKCRCVKYIYIPLTQKRFSTGQRTWKLAKEEADKKEKELDPNLRRIAELEAKAERKKISLQDAIKEWERHQLANNVSADSVATYVRTMNDFAEIARREKVTMLHEIAGSNVTLKWQEHKTYVENGETKIYSVSTLRSKRGHITNFFRFCVKKKKWLATDENPTDAFGKLLGEDAISRVPLTEEQFSAVVDATYLLDGTIKTHNRKECLNKGLRLRVFALTMRYGGQSIVDTALLRKDQLKADDSIELRRKKTDVYVCVQLPHEVAEALRHVPPGHETHPDYFFWSGRGKKSNAESTWHRTFTRLWSLVKWPTPLVALNGREQPGEGSGDVISATPHCFRHTFAFDLLQRGFDIEEVARLMGHSSSATTRRYYHNFVKGEADRLKDKLRASYQTRLLPTTAKPTLIPPSPTTPGTLIPATQSHRPWAKAQASRSIN